MCVCVFVIWNTSILNHLHLFNKKAVGKVLQFDNFHSEVPEPVVHSGARGSGRASSCRAGWGLSWLGPSGWCNGCLAFRTAAHTGAGGASSSRAPPTYAKHQWNTRAKGHSHRPALTQVTTVLLWLLWFDDLMTHGGWTLGFVLAGQISGQMRRLKSYSWRGPSTRRPEIPAAAGHRLYIYSIVLLRSPFF